MPLSLVFTLEAGLHTDSGHLQIRKVILNGSPRPVLGELTRGFGEADAALRLDQAWARQEIGTICC